MADSFSIKFDFSGVESALGQIESAATSTIRPAAQAGAQVLYEEVKLNVPVSEKGHWFHGTSFKKTGQKYWFDAGTLRDSIYQAFSEDKSTTDRATYHISWNYKKAPYGYMVENGTSRAPAHSFLRPAWDAKHGDALAAAKSTVVDEMNKVISGLK